MKSYCCICKIEINIDDIITRLFTGRQQPIKYEEGYYCYTCARKLKGYV